jgi:colicin import membrane protein
MRPVEFAPEAIIQAGQDLQAAGRNITGFALRQKVGGGNPSRLRQVWDEYLAHRSVGEAQPVAALPVEVAEAVAAVSKALVERLSALAVQLNDQAVKAAERRVQEVVRSAGEQRAQAERELADASLAVEELETKLDAAGSQVDALEGQLAALQGVNQAQAVELAQLRERLAVTEQTVQVLAVERDQGRQAAGLAREEAARLKGQVEALQSQAADLMRAVAGRSRS